MYPQKTEEKKFDRLVAIPTPLPEIHAAINETESRIDSLSKAVSELEGRLGPVISSAPSTERANAHTGCSSPLGLQIDAINDRIGNIDDRIESLIHQLAI